MRTTKFTTRHLRLYKYAISAIFALLAVGLIVFQVSFVIYGRREYYYVLSSLVWIYIMYRYVRRQLQIRHVSFDDYNFYVAHEDYEIQVPYEDIRSVEIVTLGGLYRLNLFRPSPIGKKIYFKPSLWYPLNFRKVDKEVNMLRSRVRQAWHNRREEAGNQLSSLNLDQS